MIIQTPTPDVSQSLAFYKKLNFEIIADDDGTYAVDRNAVIKINVERYARPGILLYKEDWSEEVKSIEKHFPVAEIKGGHITADSSGAWVYLLEGKKPQIKIKAEGHSLLGNYAGVSLETISIAQSQSLWEILGFKVTMGGPDQGWMAMTDSDENGVSIMKPNACPHLFYNPSLTYFNGSNNPKIIDDIRAAKVPIHEEISFFNKDGEVDNVLLKDPGGLGFFIFNDG